MTAEGSGPTGPVGDEERSDLARLITVVLPRVSAVLSLALIFLGMVLSFAHRQTEVPPSDVVRGMTEVTVAFPHSLPAVARGVRGGDGPAVVMTGILLLLVTPALRVAGAILTFAHERDRTFVLVSCLVLALLVLSLLVGRAGG